MTWSGSAPDNEAWAEADASIVTPFRYIEEGKSFLVCAWYASVPQDFWACSISPGNKTNINNNKVRIRCGFWFEWLFKKVIDQ
jgi:hypothetical protein